jgi:hypothetical protein
MKRVIREVLGERILQGPATFRHRTVTVTLGSPRRRKDGDWECPFRITGVRVQYGYGVDSIQALTTALEGIRVTLERSGKQLTWLGGETGYTGFDRFVTTSFGAKFTEHLNRTIDKEIVKYVNRLKQSHQKRT